MYMGREGRDFECLISTVIIYTFLLNEYFVVYKL